MAEIYACVSGSYAAIEVEGNATKEKNSYAWFPGIDNAVNDNCVTCRAKWARELTRSTSNVSIAPQPWHTVYVDFCGLFLMHNRRVYPGCDQCLYSGFPEVEVVSHQQNQP